MIYSTCLSHYKHIISGLFLILASCGSYSNQSSFGEINNSAFDVSVINLIATPEQYSGKIIRVSGVMILEYEGDAIYLSKADADHHVTKNGLSLQIDYAKLGFPDKKPSDSEQLELVLSKSKALKNMIGKYVFIEGIFDKDIRGHGGLMSGSINVTRIARL